MNEEGVLDFDVYSVERGASLIPDFFVPRDSTPPPGVAVTAM